MDFGEDPRDPADEITTSINAARVSQRGDIWLLGDHRLMCGDARCPEEHDALMAAKRAAMVFTSLPCTLKIPKVSARPRTKYPEASGSHREAEFRRFLTDSLGNAARVTQDGGLHYICVDWSHAGELMAAGQSVYHTLMSICVWVKGNAGHGRLYRNQHELVLVYRAGRERHRDSTEIARPRRSRSDVWRYGGVDGLGRDRMGGPRTDGAKPVALIADAMKDCTRRGHLILDPFCGSGATILAAERTGRIGYGMEQEPRSVDVAIRRWQALTRRDAIHLASGQTFDDRATAPRATSRRRARRAA